MDSIGLVGLEVLCTQRYLKDLNCHQILKVLLFLKQVPYFHIRNMRVCCNSATKGSDSSFRF